MTSLYHKIFPLIAGLILPSIGHAQGRPGSAGVDTEHIFGFTEGTDIGEKGEKELENTTTSRIGKIGSYGTFDSETSFRYGIADGLRVSLGTLFDYHSIRGVPDLNDREAFQFSGISSELRWRVLERGVWPVGITVSLNPEWRRVDDASGEQSETYALPITLLTDVAVVPDKIFAAFKLTYPALFSPLTLPSRKPRFGVTGLRFRRFPDTPLHHRRQASVRVEEGLRVAGKGLMFGAPRPAS